MTGCDLSTACVRDHMLMQCKRKLAFHANVSFASTSNDQDICTTLQAYQSFDYTICNCANQVHMS